MSNERVRVITEEQYKEYMKLKNHFGDTNKKVRRWKPEDGDDYYCVMSDGKVTTFIWNTDVTDYGHYKLGNCFETEEEAQKELDRRFAEQELLDMVDAKMSDEHEKWFIEYCSQESYFYPNNVFFRFATSFIFSSKESCKKAIKALGDEKLKLIFRID